MPRGCTVLYGSETGTAEEVAFKLLSLMKTARIDASISSLDDYDVSNLPTEVAVVFVVSTTGDGEVPASMKNFWKFLLRKSLHPTSLEGVSAAVFGLGDSSYEKFNAAARKLSKRLQQLGSKEILPIGLGDDQDRFGYSTVFDVWSKSLLGTLANLTAVVSPASTSSNASPSYRVVRYGRITEVSGAIDGDALQAADLADLCSSQAGHSPIYSPPDMCRHTARSLKNRNGDIVTALAPLYGIVKANKRMTDAEWDQDVRDIVITVQSEGDDESAVPRCAGDVATVYPRNDPLLVDRMVSLVSSEGLTADCVVGVERLPEAVTRKSRLGRIPKCTVASLFSRFLDIVGVPQRGFFEGLARFATNEDEREKLLEISSPEGTDLFYDYCIREKRNYIEILEDFKSARPPLCELLDLIPKLPPRHYSIANSGIVSTSEIRLCVAVSATRTRYGRQRVGICSGYLSRLSVGEQVVLWVRAGAFRIRELSNGAQQSPIKLEPLLLVGPGTGVAPMRAALEEMKHHFSASSGSITASGAEITRCLMFFGCRNRAKDFLYGEEWGSLVGAPESDPGAKSDTVTGPYGAVITAFSRDQPEKVYVTHKIRENGAMVWDSLQKGARVFISGSAKRMPADVRKAIKDVIIQHGEATDEQATKMLLELEKSGRYIVEAWS